ncbi:hypothetical protein A3Q56_08286 [Intoshia linei]|uniref:Uncharacterized protein n=1 Tax=Intoshia linei TaxID=1819745 RepID=A0A177AR71_9BILA|nr:hypothetical protein A3Q56_08286 [Intoshia linei]
MAVMDNFLFNRIEKSDFIEMSFKKRNSEYDNTPPTCHNSDLRCKFSKITRKQIISFLKKCEAIHTAPLSVSENVERDNRDIDPLIAAWRHQNPKKPWYLSLSTVQYPTKTRWHSGIQTSLYQAVFGVKAPIKNIRNSVIEPI